MSRSAESFRETQYQFAAHIRDPENKAAPNGIEDRRMAIYRDLFFNNINGTLKSAFPVIHALLDVTEWENMVRDFMIRHYCKTPLFVEIAREFMAYLESERQSESDPPFLRELAHYEWVELALTIADHDYVSTPLSKDEDALVLSYKLSPLAWLLVYQFPVHQISTENRPESPSETPVCLLVYRDQNDKVKFITLNTVSARLLELLDQGLSGQKAVSELVTAIQHPDPLVVTQGALGMIQDWTERGILLKQQA